MRVFVKIADAGNLSAAVGSFPDLRQPPTHGTRRGARHHACREDDAPSLADRVRSTLLRTGETDFGGGRRGGTRPDGAEGNRVRPVACERSVAARSVAVGANAARLSGGGGSGFR